MQHFNICNITNWNIFNMLIRLRLRNEGLELLFFAVLLAVLTDTGAYYSGMLFGKNKLIPEISPKKQ